MKVEGLREKVIKGLECCILRDPDDHARCSQCSYESNCVNRLKMDALELLKEQEARVLGLEELPMGTPDKEKLVYIEVPEDEEGYGEYRGYAVPEMNDGIQIWFAVFGKSMRLLCDTDSYNVTWRCWNTKPTEEQREAVKWDD